MENTHVHTVECPVCKRPWTGAFTVPLPDKSICKDCQAERDAELRARDRREANDKR